MSKTGILLFVYSGCHEKNICRSFGRACMDLLWILFCFSQCFCDIMEERIYTFYDKYQKVRYENVTAEELDFLNKSYNKEKYLMRD